MEQISKKSLDISKVPVGGWSRQQGRDSGNGTRSRGSQAQSRATPGPPHRPPDPGGGRDRHRAAARSRLPVIDIRGVSHWFATPEKPDPRRRRRSTSRSRRGSSCAWSARSGCGKTTLLNVIAQQIRPERGSVEVRLGDGVRSDRSSRQAMGYMFARDSLIAVRGDPGQRRFLVSRSRGSAAPSAARRAEATLDLVGLGGKGRLFPRQLSATACASAPTSPAPWRSSRRCCSSTSRSVHWTPRRRPDCRSSS